MEIGRRSNVEITEDGVRGKVRSIVRRSRNLLGENYGKYKKK